MPGPWSKLRSLVFLSDEEMVKKDDDHQQKATGKGGASHVLRNPHWQPAAAAAAAAHTPMVSRRNFRRIATLALVGLGVWVLLSYLSLDLGYDDNTRSRYSYMQDPEGYKGYHGPTPGWIAEQKAKHATAAVREHSYDGPTKFHELAGSLHAIAGTRGNHERNRNVLFMAASLRTAATLLPMACEMGRELRSYVHFAIIYRDPMAIEDLRRVNGIDSSCELIFHDARPDFADIATDARMQHATVRALFHINNYMHPQVIFVDGTEAEEAWFHKGARRQSGYMSGSLIELPEGASRRLSWATKLDSASLAAWEKVTVDILIQAPHTGSGSLLRLLKSLSEVDFAASAIPHLTIELPPNVEPATRKFLQKFRWPPAHAVSAGGAPQSSMLSIRHRVPSQRMTEEESSVRFLESFWPRAPHHSHVLVLSPQAQVTPHFFHYLKFSILEYVYSDLARSRGWDRRLLGLSLAVPHTTVDGGSEFKAPESAEAGQRDGLKSTFLWQAPHSDAMLFAGEKWVELHKFASKSLDRQHSAEAGAATKLGRRDEIPGEQEEKNEQVNDEDAEGEEPKEAPAQAQAQAQPQAQTQMQGNPDLLTAKTVSKQYPAWLEHVLRLSRARGYLTLYPGSETASALATIHKDLFQPPEEYGDGLEAEPRESMAPLNGDGEGRDGAAGPLVAFQDTFPRKGSLPGLDELPLLDWGGDETTIEDLMKGSWEYAMQWRQNVGGCGAKELESEDMEGSLDVLELFC